MASFVPRHSKKKDGLRRDEQALRRLIERGASRRKLLNAALRVRDDRIRVLRAKQNQNLERNATERADFLRDEEKIKALKLVTPEMILAEFLASKFSN